MKLETAIRFIDGDAPHIDPALPQLEVDTFVIDSREVKAGDVFFALSQPDYKNNGFNGDFEDATVFAAGAFENGAAVCVVRTDRFQEHRDELERFRDRIILVDDAIAALQRLARGVYLEWNKPVVAITGSAGKTTAKELAAQVLAFSGLKVLRNIKNYNNGLGHPLTVLNLAKDATYDIAVLEMGMSTPMNEIARLCRITPPDIAVELNVLPVHVEHLGSIENVAKAKAELIEGMKIGGTAVLNADDARVAAMASLSKGEVLTYGIENAVDVMAANVRFEGFGSAKFDLVIDGKSVEVSFSLDGKHNILNALAAAAVAHSLHINVEQIADGLASAKAPPQRGEILRFAEGFTVINDSYNSNPDALLSMVQMLKDASPTGARTIVIAGEMLELGEAAADIHRQTGKKIAEIGLDLLIGVRGLAENLVAGAKSAGLSGSRFVIDSNEAAAMIAREIKRGDFVLVKGSRGVRTEIVIEKLLEKYKLEERNTEMRRNGDTEKYQDRKSAI